MIDHDQVRHTLKEVGRRISWRSAASVRRGLCAAVLAVSLTLIAQAAEAEPEVMDLNALKALYARPKAIPHPAYNPYSPAKAALGRQLFFDGRLSGSSTMSCATCHMPTRSWADGTALSLGDKGSRLERHTPTLLNLAWSELLNVDGRSPTLEDVTLGPVQNPALMNQKVPVLVASLQAVPEYRAAFQQAFPGEGITPANISKAVATFERTLVSGPASFDSWIAGDESAISDEAKRGFLVFNTKAKCANCHSGWRFTDDSFHDIGLRSDDPGRGKIVKGVDLLARAFRTPGLRNIAERAPYMHTGTLTTLEDVIRHYNDGFLRRSSLSMDIHRLHLTVEEMEELVAFLKTLSSVDLKTAAQ